MADWGKFDPSSVSAILNLATASSTANEFGFTGVARAGERVTFEIVRIEETKSKDTVNQQISELESRVTELGAQIQQVSAPLTESFRCQQDFERCLVKATTGVQKSSCWISFAACLAQQFTTIASKGP